MTVKEQLLVIMRTALHQTYVEGLPDTPNWMEIINAAMRHSVLNLVCLALPLLPQSLYPSDKLWTMLEKKAAMILATNENQLLTAEEILARFEKERIDVLPMKGLLTKYHYPHPSMRTMGDIDVLCKGKQNNRVKRVLKSIGFVLDREGRMHDCYSYVPYVKLELHRQIISDESEYAYRYADIWNMCSLKDGYAYRYEMSLEEEYIFSLLHLVEHFKRGGIGVRYIMDVYVYEHFTDLNHSYVEKELDKLNLSTFYRYLVQLADYWFSTTEVSLSTSILEELDAYIFEGGTYGDTKNTANLISAKGSVRHFLKVVFPSFQSMTSLYPWLEKWPILFPFSWVLRAFQALIFRKKNLSKQWQRHTHGKKESGKKLEQFYKNVGLNA